MAAFVCDGAAAEQSDVACDVQHRRWCFRRGDAAFLGFYDSAVSDGLFSFVWILFYGEYGSDAAGVDDASKGSGEKIGKDMGCGAGSFDAADALGVESPLHAFNFPEPRKGSGG